MSLPFLSYSKKRKQAAATETEGESTQPASKRLKHSLEKKGKTDNSKAGPSTGHRSGSNSKGEFRTISSTLNVSIPPIYAKELRRGVQDVLDEMLMRYVPALGGVVVAHANVKFLGTVATIKGMKLSGKVNLCSPDHVSLLVHNVFNASIPRHHIPLESWEFEYGPAENDPEVAAEALTIKENSEDVKMTEGAEKTPHGQGHPETSTSSGGRWVHSLTGDRIGGKSGYIDFTVIGLTMANQMLSVIGSIQLDPFSPEHAPKKAVPPSPQSEEADEVLNQLMTAADDHEEDSDEVNSTFWRLGKRADEDKQAELKARQEAEAAAVIAKAAKKQRKKDKKRIAETLSQEKEAKKAKRKKVE